MSSSISVVPPAARSVVLKVMSSKAFTSSSSSSSSLLLIGKKRARSFITSYHHHQRHHYYSSSAVVGRRLLHVATSSSCDHRLSQEEEEEECGGDNNNMVLEEGIGGTACYPHLQAATATFSSSSSSASRAPSNGKNRSQHELFMLGVDKQVTSTAAATATTPTSSSSGGPQHNQVLTELPTSSSLTSTEQFNLDTSFIRHWSRVTPPFGFNGLGEFVYRRTYARYLNDGGSNSGIKEDWYQTVERVVNGTFTIQKEWAIATNRAWYDDQAQLLAQEMYRRIFEMKFLPPGRGLWAMGTKLINERKLYAALNNCAFVSTDEMDQGDAAAPFCFLMDASMLGVGVGFDTKGAERNIQVVGPQPSSPDTPAHVIDDSREGWRDSVGALLASYFNGTELPNFNYDALRPAGSPILGFGGVSQGPRPLMMLHDGIRETLDPLIGKPMSITAIVDIMNRIGMCVIAGNVRRTAEIAFGNYDNEEYIDLKDYTKNPQRQAYGWTSNNSVYAKLGMDYTKVCKRIQLNGEPGFAWLDNMREYGRMKDARDFKDGKAMGGNPCLEQTLESYEMCCLVETFPAKHEDLQDFLKTLELAFLYAKSVTLGGTKWQRTNEVMARNRRIGCSMSGLAQFVTKRGMDELAEWCDAGYRTLQQADKQISGQMGVHRSIKMTSIKPSGTVSLLAGATPGLHFPEARFYIRRVRLAADSDLIPPLLKAGYPIEPCQSAPNDTVIVEFPVDAGEGIRTAKQVSMVEQLQFAAFFQRHWADNQVSCTVTFDPVTEGPLLPAALDEFQYQLKGISFLPRFEYGGGAFAQMPYESITEQEYARRIALVKPVTFGHPRSFSVERVPDNFCDTDACQRG